MYQYLLFDLDGTITDSQEGITKCVQYALKHFGIEEEDLNKLRPFIGPPLIGSFMKYYGLTREQAVTAVAKYRERYQVKGIFENALYEGVADMLKELKANGKTLLIASSKPEGYVEQILEYFHIRSCFDEVVGATMDEKRVEKDEVIEEALRRLNLKEEERKNVLMIGDRSNDVLGAAAFGMDCVGVYYGFAGPGELEEAGAAYIVHTVEELGELLKKH